MDTFSGTVTFSGISLTSWGASLTSLTLIVMLLVTSSEGPVPSGGWSVA